MSRVQNRSLDGRCGFERLRNKGSRVSRKTRRGAPVIEMKGRASSTMLYAVGDLANKDVKAFIELSNIEKIDNLSESSFDGVTGTEVTSK